MRQRHRAVRPHRRRGRPAPSPGDPLRNRLEGVRGDRRAERRARSRDDPRGMRLTALEPGSRPEAALARQGERRRSCGPAHRLLMPSSLAVLRLTGEYVLDHHSASQCDPLYDLRAGRWIDEWWPQVAGELPKPRLLWPGEVAGEVSSAAAEETGIPAGTPVCAGTIDAWAESIAAGVDRARGADDHVRIDDLPGPVHVGSRVLARAVGDGRRRARHLLARGGNGHGRPRGHLAPWAPRRPTLGRVHGAGGRGSARGPRPPLSPLPGRRAHADLRSRRSRPAARAHARARPAGAGARRLRGHRVRREAQRRGDGIGRLAANQDRRRRRRDSSRSPAAGGDRRPRSGAVALRPGRRRELRERDPRRPSRSR